MQQIPPQIQHLFEKVKNKHHNFHTLSNSSGVVGHSLSIGLPGAGKTTGNRREAELRYELNHKIIGGYDAGRMDLAYFMFKSDSPFWYKPKVENGKIIGARAYPVELLYPVTKHLPKEIPKNGKVFTIPVCDLDEEDISAMTGSNSLEGIKSILNSMETKINKNTTPNDYMRILGNLLQKSEDEDRIKIPHHGAKTLKGKVFTPLINEGILSSKSVSTSLDIDKLIKDKKTISVLVLRHCPRKLWGFIVFYLMNHVYKRLSGIDGGKRIKQRTTIILNEVSDLLQSDGDMGESAHALSRSISSIAKQYRTANLFLLMDTQIPQQLPDIKDIIHRIYIYNSGRIEVEKACEIMGVGTRTGMITQDDLSVIPFLSSGYYYLIDKQTGVSLHKLEWLRSRTYKDGEDFYDIYDKNYGKMAYYSTKEKLDELKKEDEESKILWDLKKSGKKKTEKKEKKIEEDVQRISEDILLEKGTNELEESNLEDDYGEEDEENNGDYEENDYSKLKKMIDKGIL